MKPTKLTQTLPNNSDGHEASSARSGSLSGFGSEILIATWEAHAVQCEETAEIFDKTTKHLVCSYREKARAYRKCIEDIRRQMAHESKRQPTENDDLTHGGKKL